MGIPLLARETPSLGLFASFFLEREAGGLLSPTLGFRERPSALVSGSGEKALAQTMTQSQGGVSSPSQGLSGPRKHQDEAQLDLLRFRDPQHTFFQELHAAHHSLLTAGCPQEPAKADVFLCKSTVST